MMKYRIGLIQRVTEVAKVEVEANNRIEAEDLAQAMVNAGEIDWHFLEAPEPAEIVSIVKGE